MMTSVDITEVKVQELLENFANDYSKYVRMDLSDQVSKMEIFIEESIAKLEELSSLFEMKEAETKEWVSTTLPGVLHHGKLLVKNLDERIDALQNLVKIFKLKLDQLEVQITKAEDALGIGSSFRSVFKYFRKADNPFPLQKVPQTMGQMDLLEVDSFFQEKVVITP